MKPDVALVSMPYASMAMPSLALGLLKAILAQEGVPAKVYYPCMEFMEQVGTHLYRLCAHLSPIELQAGEWTFAAAAFRNEAPPADQLLAHLRRNPGLVVTYGESDAEQQRLEGHLVWLRGAATRFVDEAARRVVDTGARVVGCTSTFEQHVASLALLRRVRELDPSIVTMLGGANCEAEMGRATHRNFPWVDFVVSGEADAVVGPLCRAILEHGRDVPSERLEVGVLGPCHRAGARPSAAARTLFRDLDRLPVPDFDDFFEALAASPLRDAVHPGLPLETSRGCWWGARHHCTFCGLNGTSMSFRAKTPSRVLHELRALESRHGISRFETVDNILDTAYFKTLLPALAKEGRARKLFYEVKANLRRPQIDALVAGGVGWVQPGIESLDSRVLRLMDKGVAAYQNVQLLRWSRERCLRLSWALLWGFPGEDDAWHLETARIIPLLEHLQPPNGFIRLRLDRFSVYHSKREELGLRMRPGFGMPCVYPLDEDELMELSYFFREEGALSGKRADPKLQPGAAAMREAVMKWRAVFWRAIPPILSMADTTDGLEILDTRSGTKNTRSVLRGLDRAIALAGDDAPSRERLASVLDRDFGLAADEVDIEKAIARLRDPGLVIEMDGRVLTLAVSGELPHLPDHRAFPGGYVDYGVHIRPLMPDTADRA